MALLHMANRTVTYPTLCSTSIYILFIYDSLWSVGRSPFRSAHGSHTPGIFESVLHTHHIFVRFAYFTASKIFTIPIIPSVVAKKRIEHPDSKHLCISIHYLLVSIGF